MRALPPFVSPMLLKRSLPFDSESYLFEVKWDGARALASLGSGSYKLFSRRELDLTTCFPEFEFLRHTSPGALLDGEVVVLRAGKPDFALLLSRLGTRGELKTRVLARESPATFVVFDQLYENYESLMSKPLRVRREHLSRTVKEAGERGLVFSEGLRAKGKSLFEEVHSLGLEGVVAKRIESRYFPGRRCDAWLKIKSLYFSKDPAPQFADGGGKAKGGEEGDAPVGRKENHLAAKSPNTKGESDVPRI